MSIVQKTFEITAERSAVQSGAEAVGFLREVLRTPKPATEVLTLARRRGISRATLWRAKRALWVQSEKIGMKAGWA